MTMTNHIFHDAVVIRLHGDFDFSGSEVLEKSIRLAHGLSNRMVIFNCTDVTSMDGAGVGTICFALHTLSQLGIPGSLVNPPSVLRDLLDKNEMTNVIRICTTELEARKVV